MKMKKSYLIIGGIVIIALLSSLFRSCGVKTHNVAVRDIVIEGSISGVPCSDYLKVDDGKYDFTLEDDELSISIPFKVTSKIGGDYIEKIDRAVLIIKDASGNDIKDSGGKPVVLELSGRDGISRLLGWTLVNESAWLTFSTTLFGDGKEIMHSIASFSVMMDIEVRKQEKSVSSGENSGEQDKIAGSEDQSGDNGTVKKKKRGKSGNKIDRILDDYEKCIDEYAKAMKEGGLLDLALSSVSLSEKIEKLAGELEEIEGDMTEEQLTRFAEIQAKMISSIL